MELAVSEDIAGTLERRRIDTASGELIGSECQNCSARSWPGRAICSRCGSDDISFNPLPRIATLLSFTKVWVPRPGLTVPYVLGQVSFGHGATVFAHVRELSEEARVPLAVSLVLSPNPDQVPSFWFEPTS